MDANIIATKSFDFALDIIDLYKFLIRDKQEYILSKQLLRSGTSIGANVKEGIRGFSKSDFRFKMNIALKEANETEYWIELLIKSSIIEQITGNSILLKCRELCKILNSIVKNSI
ncbi:four helix bundle protein [Candidatus Clostridium helianthi]|uniref:Four helix bundle protein n=1 Tax=Candidatus Clostridium helianthi TaxID=3381660 RepID=A0ABW8S0T4_9CLOT